MWFLINAQTGKRTSNFLADCLSWAKKVDEWEVGLGFQ